ncbi:MAG: response regulator transcription factor [Acidimicrobiia bacterium]
MDHRSRVLIVDNDPDVLCSMRAIFDAEGYAVTLAADGSSARRVYEEHRPDAIILDIAMPVLDGWYFLAHLAGEVAPPPVIITALKAHPLDVARAKALGACDFFV